MLERLEEIERKKRVFVTRNWTDFERLHKSQIWTEEVRTVIEKAINFVGFSKDCSWKIVWKALIEMFLKMKKDEIK